jgi:hypothetical protein
MPRSSASTDRQLWRLLGDNAADVVASGNVEPPDSGQQQPGVFEDRSVRPAPVAGLDPGALHANDPSRMDQLDGVADSD